jgi:methyl-accepting chemotaxis protein
MTGRRAGQRRRLYALVVIAVLVFVVLSALLYRIVNDAVRNEVTGQTRAAASTAAVAVSNAIREDTRLAGAIVGEGGTPGVVLRNASRADSYAVQYANINIQRANPQVTALYYYDSAGNFIIGQRVNPSHRPPTKLSVSCDATNTYCTDGNAPTTSYLRGPSAKPRLAALLRDRPSTNIALAFGRDLGPFGALFVAQPIPAAAGHAYIGLLVMQVDASTVFSPYLAEQEHRNLILDANVVIGRDMPSYHALGQLPVAKMTTGIDPLLTGGLVPAPISLIHQAGSSQISLDGTDLVGSEAPVGAANLNVVSYTNANVLSNARSGLILAATPLVLLMILSVVGPVYYQSRRSRQYEREQAAMIKTRSDNLVRDIMAVAESLETARGGAAAESEEGRSEVDRLSHSLSRLLGKYSAIARGVAEASQVVEQAATRIESSFSAAMEAAAEHRKLLTAKAERSRQTAEDALTLRQVTSSVEEADLAVRDVLVEGKDAGSQMPGAFDLLKTAIVDLSREFDHAKDYSNRLSAATAAVKTLAESVQAQATYAMNATGYPTGSTGEAVAQNLGRLARQAKSALAEVEAAGRGVNSSVALMGPHLEHIWDQFRDALARDHKAAASLDAVIDAYGKLVESITTLSAKTGEQISGAHEAAAALETISERFNTLRKMLAQPQIDLSQLKSMAADLRSSANDLEMQDIRLRA